MSMKDRPPVFFPVASKDAPRPHNPLMPPAPPVVITNATTKPEEIEMSKVISVMLEPVEGDSIPVDIRLGEKIAVKCDACNMFQSDYAHLYFDGGDDAFKCLPCFLSDSQISKLNWDF